jgi:hypothetical protein
MKIQPTMTALRLRENRLILDRRLKWLCQAWLAAGLLAGATGTIAMACCLFRAASSEFFCRAALFALGLWGFFHCWYQRDIRRWLAVVDPLMAQRKF